MSLASTIFLPSSDIVKTQLSGTITMSSVQFLPCPRCGFDSNVPLPSVLDVSLQSPRAQELVSSNLVPSDSEADYFHSLSSQHAQILQDIDAHILKAEAALALLRQERQKIGEEISRCKAIAHPIRRLPGELLCEIFLACVGESLWDQEHAPKSLEKT